MDNIRYARTKATDTVNHIIDLDMPTLPLCLVDLPETAKLSTRVIGTICPQCAARLKEMQEFQRNRDDRF